MAREDVRETRITHFPTLSHGLKQNGATNDSKRAKLAGPSVFFAQAMLPASSSAAACVLLGVCGRTAATANGPQLGGLLPSLQRLLVTDRGDGVPACSVATPAHRLGVSPTALVHAIHEPRSFASSAAMASDSRSSRSSGGDSSNGVASLGEMVVRGPCACMHA